MQTEWDAADVEKVNLKERMYTMDYTDWESDATYLSYGDAYYVRVVYNTYEQCVVMLHFNIVNTVSAVPDKLEYNRVTYTIKTHNDFNYNKITEFQPVMRIKQQVTGLYWDEDSLYHTHRVPCQRPHYWYHPYRKFFFYVMDEDNDDPKIIITKFTHNTGEPSGACDIDYDESAGMTLKAVDLPSTVVIGQSLLYIANYGDFDNVEYIFDKNSDGFDRIIFWEDYAYITIQARYKHYESYYRYTHCCWWYSYDYYYYWYLRYGEALIRWDTTDTNTVDGSNSFKHIISYFSESTDGSSRTYNGGTPTRFGTIVALVYTN
jgi:hypothetical protein